MFIQSSELTANPGRSISLREMMPRLRDTLSQASGKEWWAWGVLTGRPYGTHFLSSRFDDFADMAGALAGVGASSEWAELSEGADGVLAHPAATLMGEVVATTGEPGPPKQFVTVTQATMAGSGFGDALGWAVEIMEHGYKVTGQGGTLLSSASGPLFHIMWISGVDSPEELDAGHQAISADAGYLEMIAHAGASGMFVDGSAERATLVKMP